jgi:hypothetical protein
MSTQPTLPEGLTDVSARIHQGYQEVEWTGYLRRCTEQATEIAELKAWKDAVLDSLAVSCGDCAIGTPPAEILKLVASINESLLSEFHKAKLAEVMPLTNKQLRELHHIEEFGLFCSYEEFEQIARAIEQLLKG